MKVFFLIILSVSLVFSACQSTGDASRVFEEQGGELSIKRPRANNNPTLDSPPEPQVITIPNSADWTDHGNIFSVGAEGEWDAILWGGFSASAVKHNDKYFLYYQGSDGYDEVDETVTHRAIGIATSTDGFSYEKYEGNPVITWLPNQDIEEGAASNGAWVENDEVFMYFGANELYVPGQVSADARLAKASDGFTFTNGGVALNHLDGSVYGVGNAGDEAFPILGFSDEGVSYLYYLPNTACCSGKLGVSWGSSPTTLTENSAVTIDGANVMSWGPAGFAKLTDGLYALFLSTVRADAHGGPKHMDVYLMRTSNPSVLEGPIESYFFTGFAAATVLLDEEAGKWFMYYREDPLDGYGLKTAPIVYEEQP